MLQVLNVLLIDMKNVSILTVIILKNRLSHVVFVISFSQQLVLRYVVGIFTFGMTLVIIFEKTLKNYCLKNVG